MGTNTLNAFVKEPLLVSTTQEDFGWEEMYWMGTNTMHFFVKEAPLVSSKQEDLTETRCMGWKQIRMHS